MHLEFFTREYKNSGKDVKFCLINLKTKLKTLEIYGIGKKVRSIKEQISLEDFFDNLVLGSAINRGFSSYFLTLVLSFQRSSKILFIAMSLKEIIEDKQHVKMI